MLQPLKVAQSPEAKFREYLTSRSKPQRFTKSAQEMVRFIFSQHQHFDAEQLCAALDQARVNISRATVYRTLSKLVDAGLLRRMHLGQRDVYEHDYGYPEHAHLHCEQCGKMIEFECPELEPLVAEASRRHHFQASSMNLLLRGTCMDCLKSRMTKRRLDLV